MNLSKNDFGEWTFVGGKHDGRSFREVASLDPSYLVFVYWKMTTYWTDEQVWSLQDALNAYSINFSER